LFLWFIRVLTLSIQIEVVKGRYLVDDGQDLSLVLVAVDEWSVTKCGNAWGRERSTEKTRPPIKPQKGQSPKKSRVTRRDIETVNWDRDLTVVRITHQLFIFNTQTLHHI